MPIVTVLLATETVAADPSAATKETVLAVPPTLDVNEILPSSVSRVCSKLASYPVCT